MTDTTISGAVAFPQDAGSGVPEDEEDYSSAGFFSLLSKYKGEGSYVGEDTSGDPTLQFNDVDTTAEQVDVSTGYAYIMDSMSVQSGFQTVYDVALPNESPYVVILPDEVVNLDLGTDNVNDVWLAVDPNSNDSVYIRHGNGLTEPSDPFVKLGTVDTSSGATTRTNDGAPSGAFRDEDGDNVYTLPNSTDGIEVGSVSTPELGNGPIAFSSEYATIQAALDTAGHGHLFIDDTKTEEAVKFGQRHNGVTVQWVGDNYIEQPQNPTLGQSVIDLDDQDTGSVKNVTLIQPQITNPHLADADIGDETTVTGSDRTSAIALPSNATSNTIRAEDWEIIRPRIDHVQGYGIRFNASYGTNVIRDGIVSRTAYDNYYIKEGADQDPDVQSKIINCDGFWAGRHNFSIAGDFTENRAVISGYGEDAFRAGVDIENGQNVRLDATVRNAARGVDEASGTPGGVSSGLNVSSGSNACGFIKSINSSGFSADLNNADIDGLTVVYEQPVAASTSVEVSMVHARGSVSVVGSGGGSDQTAVRVGNNNASELLDLNANISNSYASSVLISRGQKVMVDVVSHNPVQGEGSVSNELRSHVAVNGFGGDDALDNVVRLTATDTDGNADYGVASGGSTDYNQFSGNVRGAYATSATDSLGTNSDTSDLLG